VIYPELSAGMQALVRTSYGVFLFLTLMAALPHARRYFCAEQWGGYTQTGILSSVIQRPVVVGAWLVLWGASALALILGRMVVAASAFNLLTCYYFFNRLRWTSLSRGMGAPGFIAMWLGAAVFLLEVTSAHMPSARSVALLTLQVDFGLIMVSAGVYKLVAGYRQWSGMELGMANPEWGYWSTFWSRWSPRHPLFRFLNEMAWGTEVVCGVLMLFPATRAWGGAGIALSFVFIASQIRLGFLCEMVITCCLLFFTHGTWPDQWLSAVWPVAPRPEVTQPWPTAAAMLIMACWAYMALLPFVRVGMFYNQLKHRSWPTPVQRALDAYANACGLILWRVFTADVVNFFVRVWEVGAGPRRQITNYSGRGWARFAQVAECIVITSVFTTLKYFPSNRELFEQKLLRYARTIPHAPNTALVFEWVHMRASVDGFAPVPVAEFAVDGVRATVIETTLSDHVSVRAVAGGSPVHEGSSPGSYAPRAPRTVS
jgi:hypothetical protein